MDHARAPAAALLALSLLPAAAAGQTGLVIEDGQAQIVPAFADSSHLDPPRVVGRDRVSTPTATAGPTACTWMSRARRRPMTMGLRVPVIYETSPYYSGVAGVDLAHFWDIRQEVGGEPRPRDPFPPTIAHVPSQPRISRSHVATWVPRGFAVVSLTVARTGQSQGCPTVGGANESLAPKAVIDWAQRTGARLHERGRGRRGPGRTGATGRVGMTGTSYNGTLPLAAATTGVEGLEAIVPVAPNTSYYHYYRSNGLVRSPGGYPGEDVDVLFDFIFSGFPDVRGYCLTTVRDEMTANLDRMTGDYSDFWAGRDYVNHIDGVRAATLMSHGFNDWNVMPEHSYRISMALRERGVPLQIFYHQGGHGGPPPQEVVNRWFTRYVAGVENGVEDDPGAWIVREGDDLQQPTPYPSYPHPEAEAVALHPGGDGQWTGVLSLDGPADGRGGDPGTGNHHRQLLVRGRATRRGRMVEPPPPLRDARTQRGRTSLRRGDRPRARVGGRAGGQSVRLAGVPALDRERRPQRQRHHQRLGRPGQRGCRRDRLATHRHAARARGTSLNWSSICNPTIRSSPPAPASAS